MKMQWKKLKENLNTLPQIKGLIKDTYELGSRIFEINYNGYCVKIMHNGLAAHDKISNKICLLVFKKELIQKVDFKITDAHQTIFTYLKNTYIK